MAVIIGLFVYAGFRIDEHYGNDPMLVTAVFSILGVAVALYNLYRRI